MFRGVNDVIARYRVNGDDRSGKIHRQVMRCRGWVARFVADRRAHRIGAGGKVG